MNCNLFFIPVEIQCPRYWSCSLWIGASRNPITSNFLYNSGKPIVHPKWGLFQPNNENGIENCGLLLRSGELNDAGCIVSDFHYICKTKNDVLSLMYIVSHLSRIISWFNYLLFFDFYLSLIWDFNEFWRCKTIAFIKN